MAKSKSAKKRGRARVRAARSPARPVAERDSTSRASRPSSQKTRRGGAAEEPRIRYRETTGGDRRRNLLYVALFVTSAFVAGTVIAPRRGAFAAVLLVLVTLWVLVAWHNKGYAYRCANCRRVFRVPTLVNFLSFQGVGRRPDGTYRGWKSLTCPYCHQRTKATVVRKVEPDNRPKRRSPGSDAQLLR